MAVGNKMKKGAQKIDPQQGVDKPHVVAVPLIEQTGEEVPQPEGLSAHQETPPVVDEIPHHQGNPKLGQIFAVEWSNLTRPLPREHQVSAQHEEQRNPHPGEGIQCNAQLPGRGAVHSGVGDHRHKGVEEKNRKNGKASEEIQIGRTLSHNYLPPPGPVRRPAPECSLYLRC